MRVRSSSPSCVVALIAPHTRRFVVNSERLCTAVPNGTEGYEEVIVPLAVAAFAHKQERKNSKKKMNKDAVAI